MCTSSIPSSIRVPLGADCSLLVVWLWMTLLRFSLLFGVWSEQRLTLADSYGVNWSLVIGQCFRIWWMYIGHGAVDDAASCYSSWVGECHLLLIMTTWLYDMNPWHGSHTTGPDRGNVVWVVSNAIHRVVSPMWWRIVVCTQYTAMI